MGQGRESAKEYIKNNADFYSLLENKIRERIIPQSSSGTTEEA
jgi:hypothetical protein